MTNENTIKNLIILILAVIIVIALWRTIWYLAGVAMFVLLVYFRLPATQGQALIIALLPDKMTIKEFE